MHPGPPSEAGKPDSNSDSDSDPETETEPESDDSLLSDRDSVCV